MMNTQICYRKALWTRCALHVVWICSILLILPMGSDAQRPMPSGGMNRKNIFPDLVAESVTVIAPTTGSEMVWGDRGTLRHTYRICVRNAGFLGASVPSDPGWWSVIWTFPDDKGGRPNAHYWSRVKIDKPLAAGATYCFDKNVYITYCRASAPRIRVSADADKGINESNEDNNRKDFYPPAVCLGG